VVNYRSSTEEADEVVGAVKAAGGRGVRDSGRTSHPTRSLNVPNRTALGRVDVLGHNAVIRTT